MKQKVSWYEWLGILLKEFKTEIANKPQYEIVDLLECKKTGFTVAIVKLSERHTIEEYICDLINNNELISYFDPITIRTLTYLATLEQLQPDCSIVMQKMTAEVDEYILEIKSKKERCITKTSPSELSKNKVLIAKFNPVEAHRIGYMAGVRETVREYQMVNNKA